MDANRSRGKIATELRVSLNTSDDLSRHYTPGVAEQARRVAENPDRAAEETVRANSVAVISDGSALLGLGDQGPAAALPVMEGKAALLKRFAGLDAWQICPVSRKVDDVVRTVRDVATSFGAVNLEDIAAPRCFEIARRLEQELDRPIFHDDQHGTAIVVLAALRNALAETARELRETSVVISGAGAAGSGVARLLLAAGCSPERLLVCDSEGALHPGRDDLLAEKRWLAEHTNAPGQAETLQEALHGADVFIGVSAGGLLGEADVAAMAERPIVFALANPDPEIDPQEARRHAAVVATGRSDQPNQINNALAFPGVFRGLLDGRRRSLTTEMQLAAAAALSRLAPGGVEHIVPQVFDERLVPALSTAVAGAGEADSPA